MSALPGSRKMGHDGAMSERHAPILSYPFDLTELGDTTREVVVTADAAQCAAIAASFSLPAIAQLSGRFKLSRRRSGPVEVRLDLAAVVTQTCVVSLEPFEQRVAERTTLALLTEAQGAALDPQAPIDPDAPDEIVATGSVVDLGAILVEQLALALDPYPRRPGAAIPADAEADTAPVSPFAVLATRGPR